MMNFFKSKYPKYGPYECIKHLDEAIKKFSEVVFKQQDDKSTTAAAAEVIKYSAMLLAADVIANRGALCSTLSEELREGFKDASTRNTAVARMANFCVDSGLMRSKEFSDCLANYEKASKVARGEDNFKNVVDCGYLWQFKNI